MQVGLCAKYNCAPRSPLVNLSWCFPFLSFRLEWNSWIFSYRTLSKKKKSNPLCSSWTVCVLPPPNWHELNGSTTGSLNKECLLFKNEFASTIEFARSRVSILSHFSLLQNDILFSNVELVKRFPWALKASLHVCRTCGKYGLIIRYTLCK